MKSLSEFVSFGLAVALLAGCTTNTQNVNQLSAGMTKPQVIAILGEPKTSMSPGNGVEVLTFRLTQSRAYRLAVPLHPEYLVRFTDGKVSAYGTRRELKASHLDPQERTVNVNIKSDAPVQPVISP